jgi:hypothetical protein
MRIKAPFQVRQLKTDWRLFAAWGNHSRELAALKFAVMIGQMHSFWHPRQQLQAGSALRYGGKAVTDVRTEDGRRNKWIGTKVN